MEKDIAKFVCQCLHCVDSKAGSAMPRPLGDLVHSTEVGDVLHFDYLSLGESDVVDAGGLIDGGYKHVLVLMDGLSRFVWLEGIVSCSMEEAARFELKWSASFGVPKAFTNDDGTDFFRAGDGDGVVTIGSGSIFWRGECFVVVRDDSGTDEP